MCSGEEGNVGKLEGDLLLLFLALLLLEGSVRYGRLVLGLGTLLGVLLLGEIRVDLLLLVLVCLVLREALGLDEDLALALLGGREGSVGTKVRDVKELR